MSRELRLRIDAVVPIEGRDAFKMIGQIEAVQKLVETFVDGLRDKGGAVGVSAPLVVPRSRSDRPRVDAPILTAIEERGGQLGSEHEPPVIDLTGRLSKTGSDPVSQPDDPLHIPAFLRKPQAEPSAAQ